MFGVLKGCEDKMNITIVIFFNIVFGFLFHRALTYLKGLQKIKQYPLGMKITMLIVNFLCLLSFIMQVVLLHDKEYQLAMSMQLLACILLYVSGNMMKSQEQDK